MPIPTGPFDGSPDDEAPVSDLQEQDEEDHESQATTPAGSAVSTRGVVRTAIRAQGRVPFLLDEVIKCQLVVARAERDLQKSVVRARAHGATWEDIGLALRMSRQGATKRFG